MTLDELKEEHLEYPEDIVSRLLKAADTASTPEQELLREAAQTIHNLRNGMGG